VTGSVDIVASPPRLRLIFTVLSASTVAFALLQSLVIPTLPTLQGAFNTSQATATWILSAYLLSAAVCTPIMGRIGDTIGRQRAVVVTLAVLSVGSLLAAVAPNIGVMIAARIIQGIGGGVVALAFGVIRDEFPKEQVIAAVGTIASLTALGAAFGVVLAGPIIDTLDYHWLFWLPMIITATCAVAAAVLIPPSRARSHRPLNWRPAPLLSAWLVALLLGISKAAEWGWASGRVLGLFALAAVFAVAWARTELAVESPLIDLTMMRLPIVWTTNLIAMLNGAGMFTAFAFIPQLAQTPTADGYGLGATVTESGLLILPWAVAQVSVGVMASRLERRLGGRAQLIAGCLTCAAALLLFAFVHDHVWQICLTCTLLGLGMGFTMSTMAALMVTAVPPSQVGVAGGMNANIRGIGGSVGAAMMATVLTAHANAAGVPAEHGYTIGFAILAGFAVTAAAVGLLIPATRPDWAADEVVHPELGIVAVSPVID
jgi:EmrB/QacA subfamily drug resistance transporter